VADVNATGIDQWTALHFSINSEHNAIVIELLKQNQIDLEPVSTTLRTPLHIAAMKGLTGICKALIDKGANPNCRDFDQNTPLHFCAEFGAFQTIIYLIEKTEADPTLKNQFGYMPRDIAQNLQTR